jgi:hypothetical protein
MIDFKVLILVSIIKNLIIYTHTLYIIHITMYNFNNL